MSEFHELCLRRQTCRNFLDRPVEHEKLAALVQSARTAPSACNSQPWSFVVVESPDKVAEVAKLAMQMGANGYIAGAKAFIVVVEEHAVLKPFLSCIINSQQFAAGDLGAATVMLSLEAASQGLGVCQISVFDRENLRPVLGIPADKPIAALLALGYPADPKIRDKDRKPLEAIARFV